MSAAAPKKRKLKIPLDSDHETAAALGRLLGHWGLCEYQLAMIFSFLLGTDAERARWTWEAFVSAKAKIELMQKLCTNSALSKQRKDELLELLTTAVSLNSKRNTFIHSMWTGRPGDLSRVKNTASGRTVRHNAFETVTASQARDVVEELAELNEGLQRWYIQHLEGLR